MTDRAEQRIRFGFAWLLGPAFVVGIAASAFAEAPTFDYLHIAANEGGSSGGHVAVRFDDWTYHFQRSEDALLQVYRDDSDAFRHRYAVLGNRAIRAHRVGVDEETYERLRAGFNTLYLAELKRSATLNSLRADESLMAALAGRSTVPLEIRGSGYFYPSLAEEENPGTSREPSTVVLQRRIERIHGVKFFERREVEIDRALRDLDPASFAHTAVDTNPSNPVPAYGFSDRYLDLVTARTALEVLRTAPVLREDAYRRPPGAEYELNAAERAGLTAVSERLAQDLTHLIDSRRPDWGYPFLVGVARLAAIRESIESGSAVVLDAYLSGTPAVDPKTFERRGAEMQLSLLEELRTAYQRSIDRLERAKDPGEAVYARFEEAVNRLDEFETAVSTGSELRVSRWALLPDREGPPAPGFRPNAYDIDFEAAYLSARDSRRAYQEKLRRDHGYNLVGRNCASEIFRTINSAMGPQPVAESTARLGGYIDPDSDLTFVPFISADAVLAKYNVIETTETPAYRQARLREMYVQENDALVYLREFNTVTSTVYSRNLDDSSFFAFTDDVVFVRPLLGLMNVAEGLGHSIWGIVRAPFDRGETLVEGLRATMYSLPELAFVNIRKGSQYYVAPEYRSSVVEQPIVLGN